jgi:MFS family permease
MACGTLVGLNLYATTPYLAFVLGGAVAALAGFIFLVWLPPAPAAEEEPSSSEPLDIGSNLLGFGSAWNQGVLEAGMMALVPVYLLGIGFTEGNASWLMSGVILGLIGAQLPIAWLADRLGRTAVLLGCYTTASLGLVCLPFCSDPIPLAFWMGLVGICAGAFYPLGLALLSENVPAGGLARANATFLAINCLGSVLGPVAAGAAMDQWGGRALFDVGLATVGLTLSIWGVSRWLSAAAAPAKTPVLGPRLVRSTDARTPLVPPG